MNYKLLTVKKLIDKGQRGDSVTLQNRLLSDAGYTNHKTKLIDQAKSITNSPWIQFLNTIKFKTFTYVNESLFKQGNFLYLNWPNLFEIIIN